ncbi:hypothetical protein IIB51_03205 [Patescibacteria group bacterium]|nr:hypothetical protein [Patescibacteria group bacterium]MCH8889227.1 hypothetical protein [Patescibacteria group bacterium]
MNNIISKLEYNTAKVITFGALTFLFAPFIAFAQAGTVQQLIGIVGGIIALAIPVVISLALLYFFWGLAKFILHADDESERAKGKSIMVWGIVALFVIVTVWGIIAVLQSTFIGPGGITGCAVSVFGVCVT